MTESFSFSDQPNDNFLQDPLEEPYGPEWDESPPEERPTPRPSRLETTELAALFGPDGPVAATLEGYELRASQVQMAEAVKQAILERRTALVEAPTGTGKSIAYLLPALLSGRTVVVATANKSLQNQLHTKDIPFLRRILGQEINAVVVKGRSNFVCTYKWEQEEPIRRQLAFYGDPDEQVNHLRTWLDETETGDVDDLPFVLRSDLRSKIVSFPDDCLHRDCRHYRDHCYVNWMRDRAREAQVIITNHHLLLNALELGEAGRVLLPEASIYVIDEAHQLEATATAVFDVTVSDFALPQLLGRAAFKQHINEERLEELRVQNALAFSEVEHLGEGTVFRLEEDLEEFKKLATALRTLLDEMRRDNPYTGQDAPGHQTSENKTSGQKKKESKEEAEARASYELAMTGLSSLISKLSAVASSKRDDQVVRYVELLRGRQVRVRVHASPINPAALLSEHLFGDDKRTVVCTSATLATNGHFEHFKARCGVAEGPIELIVDPVFDYPSQALLYQPSLPAYNWRAKDRYYDAVADEIERLLEVSRGRALCLFTNWSGLQQVQERLAGCDWPLRAQGDAPRAALLDWFRATPYSVLLATRSFWEGVDLPGDDLSLVVLDKMPFPTPSDPLHAARMKALEEAQPGSSFGQYMLPLMTLALKQGFGRLIRRRDDRGVVAILDERLTSKSYGRQAHQDLPPAPFTRRFGDVHRFFRDALGSRADFALNVHAEPSAGGGSIFWRWRLLRMQDGKAEGGEGVLKKDDPVAGEIFAATQGLRDLRRRIAAAGRKTHAFGVELRCSPATEQTLAAGSLDGSLAKKWVNECSVWGALRVIAVPRSS